MRLIPYVSIHVHPNKELAMSNIDLQKKALQFIKEKGWDSLLVSAFLEVKHYPSWALRDDFEEKWNIGVKNVRGETKFLKVGYGGEDVRFCVGEIAGIAFKIGGDLVFSTMPDGELFVTLPLELYLDDKKVMAVRYVADSSDPILDSDFSLLSIEEFHNDDRIDTLLKEISRAKHQLKERRRLSDLAEKESNLEGKFTF